MSQAHDFCEEPWFVLPIKNWSRPLSIADVACDRNRPPGQSGLVYVVSGSPAPDKDIRYVGSSHATNSTDDLQRLGSLLGALLGFNLWHGGGRKLYDAYTAEEIKKFYILWSLISGCPVLAERELRAYHLSRPAASPAFKLCWW